MAGHIDVPILAALACRGLLTSPADAEATAGTPVSLISSALLDFGAGLQDAQAALALADFCKLSQCGRFPPASRGRDGMLGLSRRQAGMRGFDVLLPASLPLLAARIHSRDDGRVALEVSALRIEIPPETLFASSRS